MHCFASKFSTWMGCLETSPLFTIAKDRPGPERSKYGEKEIRPECSLSHTEFQPSQRLIILLSIMLFFLSTLPILWKDWKKDQKFTKEQKTYVISHLDILISSLGEALPDSAMKSKATFYVLGAGCGSQEQGIRQLIICLQLFPQ